MVSSLPVSLTTLKENERELFSFYSEHAGRHIRFVLFAADIISRSGNHEQVLNKCNLKR